MESVRPSYNLRDQLLEFSGQFPDAAGTVYSDVFDMESIGQRGVRIDPFELVVESPELTAEQLPDGASFVYSLQFSDTADFSGEVVEWTAGAAWAQTGSAEGAATFEGRYRVETTQELRYVRAKCVASGSPAATGLGFTLIVVT